MTTYTRADYMAQYSAASPEMRMALHRKYYAQFVTPMTRAYVLRAFGLARLRSSTDPHFNDIPLKRWDGLVSRAPGSEGFRHAGDYYTIAGGVCMLKEAARQIVEAHHNSIEGE